MKSIKADAEQIVRTFENRKLSQVYERLEVFELGSFQNWKLSNLTEVQGKTF